MYSLSPASSVALNLTRVMAAQAVLIGHLWSVLGLLPSLQPPNMAYVQNVAVTVFFLLSGLLIAYTVEQRSQNPNYRFRNYAVDRFARIYSGLIPALVFIAVIDGFQIKFGSYEHLAGYSLSDFVGNIFMLQDFPYLGKKLGVTSFGSGRILWTLAIEWWLYMAYGWILLKKHHDGVYWAGLLILAWVPAVNLVAGRGNGLTAMWLFGVAAFVFLKSGIFKSIFWTHGLALSVILGMLAIIRLHLIKEAYDVLFVLLAASSLLILIQSLDNYPRTISRPLAGSIDFIARYSFTLYLIHLTIVEFINNFFHIGGWLQFVATFLVANFIAVILASVTEMKHRSLARFLQGFVKRHPAKASLA